MQREKLLIAEAGKSLVCQYFPLLPHAPSCLPRAAMMIPLLMPPLMLRQATSVKLPDGKVIDVPTDVLEANGSR